MVSLLLVLLLQTNPIGIEARELLDRGTDGMDQALDEFDTIIDTRLYDNAAKPHTGLRAESQKDIGDDGLHAALVVSIIPDAPADRVGIAVGDRIVAIGPRTLEHESSEIIHTLLHSEGGPITLKLERDGLVRTVTIEREPIPCLKRAVDLLDQAKWHSYVAEFRQANGRLKQWLADTPDDAVASFMEIHKDYQQLQGHLNEAMALFQAELGLRTVKACVLDE